MNRSSTSTAAALRRAASSVILIENLELRRLLSGGYTQDRVITDNDPAPFGQFGQSIATNGNLALIGAPEHTGPSPDNLAAAGKVNLVDTSTGALVKTFTDPNGPAGGAEFGRSVAWVGGKIAISEINSGTSGAGKVFIYDDANDTTPFVINDPYHTDGGFGLSMATYGSDLLVAATSGQGNGNGSITRFDTTTGAIDKTYTDNGAIRDDQLGNTIAVDGTDIYATSWHFNDLVNPDYKQVVVEFDGEGAGDTVLHTIVEQPVGDSQNDFGTAIAATANTVLISAPGEDVVYELNKDTRASLRNYTVANTADEFHFIGTSIVVDGTKVLFGDSRSFAVDPQTQMNNSEGDAHVFDLTNGAFVATIANPTPQADSGNGFPDQFGAPAAALPDGKFLIADVTEDTDNQVMVDTGAVWVFSPPAVANQPPTANAGAPQTTTENSTVTLDASGSTDPDGNADITQYLWDLDNDGQYDDATGVTTPFSQDLPGAYTVGLKVVDSAGHESTATTSVTFTDVHPTADAGGNQTAAEGTGVSLHGSGNNTSGDAIVAYAWDLDNNGTFETPGQNINFNPDLPGNYPVTLRVTDDDGDTATSSATITISDVAPTANAGPNQTGITGQTLNFNGSGTTAPGDSITSYTWDFNYNGTTFNSQASGASTTHSYAAIGTYTVALKVTDDDGQTAISTASAQINNTTPTANTVGGASSAVRQQAIGFTGSFTDPDANDPHDVSWNFGDGTVIAFHSSADVGALTPQHAYLATGTYTVTMTVRDSHGALSTSAPKSVAISITQMVGGDLYVGGTSAKDTMTITKATGGIFLDTQDTNKTFYPVTTGKVVIFGGDGDDSIKPNSDVPVAFEIYGGAGKDTLNGAMMNDILVGGPGNDVITAQDGRDIAIGGDGADAVTSNNGDDILIAGPTSFDNDPASLRAVMAEWGSSRTYTERVNNIRDGSGSATRLNGNVFLQADVTVFDDAITDTLTGNTGTDWFFANVDLGIKDKLDAKTGEVVSDVDIIV